MVRKCMRCKLETTRVDSKNFPQWYKVVGKYGRVVGYHCGRCHDKIRRLPLFQDFKKKLNQRLCCNCGNKTIVTTTGKGYPHQRWYKDGKGGFWCNSCYHKITDDPEVVKIRNSSRIKYRDKIIHIGYNPRTGVCSLCGRVGRTNIHHLQYHEEDPLKDTIEVCPSCHMKETMKIHGLKSLRWKV